MSSNARWSASARARCRCACALWRSEEIVERQTFGEVPPRVEYALTDKGRALLPIIDDMRAYGERWLGAECGDGEAVAEALAGVSVAAA